MHRHLCTLAVLLIGLVAISACLDDHSTTPESTAADHSRAALFGEDIMKGQIGDRVWLDANCDGIQNKEENGVPGVGVTLYTCEGSAVAATTTDASGFYLFTDVEPGDYRVCFDLPDGHEFTQQDAGSDDEYDSDVDPTTGCTDCFTLEEEKGDDTRDAGLCKKDEPEKGQIGDRVWLDDDCDGIQDKEEKGVGGVEVTLYDCEENEVASTTTDDTGFYCFDDLEAGDYFVCFELPLGYEFSPQNQGADDAYDSDASPISGCTPCFTLDEGESDKTVDAGLCEEKKDEGVGCTPGFWKTKPYLWEVTGYSPDDKYNEVFGCDLFDDDFTLYQAIWQGGGGVKRLGRHSVAALLSAAHPLVGYALSVQDVLDAVCEDGDADLLEENNELGCPIDAHGRLIDGDDEGGDDLTTREKMGKGKGKDRR